MCIANVSRKDERHSKKLTVRLSLLPALHHGAVMMIFWSSQMRWSWNLNDVGRFEYKIIDDFKNHDIFIYNGKKTPYK